MEDFGDLDKQFRCRGGAESLTGVGLRENVRRRTEKGKMDLLLRSFAVRRNKWGDN